MSGTQPDTDFQPAQCAPEPDARLVPEGWKSTPATQSLQGTYPGNNQQSLRWKLLAAAGRKDIARCVHVLSAAAAVWPASDQQPWLHRGRHWRTRQPATDLCPSPHMMRSPAGRCHSFQVLSSLAVARMGLLGCSARLATGSRWPCKRHANKRGSLWVSTSSC